MRILSQDGMGETWDIPYEIAVIIYSKYTEDRHRIYAQGTFAGINPNENFIQIAEYSTEAKAKRAMEMLHGKYSTLRFQEVFDRSVNTSIYESSEKDDKLKFFDATFQFPADDELEGKA